MSVYAKGRKAVAISDRSGFRVPYKNLRTEWNGSRVASDEYEPKHPQLTPSKNIIDATALFKPRPDNDPENVSFYVGYNWFGFQNVPTDADGFTQPSMDSRDYEKPNETVGWGRVGSFSITISVSITETGVAGTGAIGTEALTASITETGVAGTGAIGTEVPTASITETGVAGTGAIGTEALTASITETGVAGTGAIGTETIYLDNPTWGTGTWGTGAWGQ
jgi:hypothetical protein